jgi:hypothetical protein
MKMLLTMGDRELLFVGRNFSPPENTWFSGKPPAAP